MSSPERRADRPVPDAADLRLVAELVNNVSIPLAHAAWNAQMSQSEAAARLVSMAERGMPLRLVADGDRQVLWQIWQAGPAQGAAAQTVPAAQTGPPQAGPEARASAAAPEQTFAGPSAPGQQAPEAPGSGQPGSGQPGAEQADPEQPGPETPAPGAPVPDADDAPTSRWMEHPVTGPANEQLRVTIREVVDPANDELAASGQPVADGYRAVLVHSSVANVGGVRYPATGDANLVVETDQHVLLGRSDASLPSRHTFPPSIAPGETADGWSVFVIPATTVLTGLKWCIRPDIPETIIGWPIVPS